MSAIPHVYEFPVIYQQNRIENIQQMLDSLEHLERISVSVFQKITDKVNEQRNTLQKVQQRAAVAKKAVEWVQNERKNEATRVLSSPHFPDKDISNVEYSPTFSARDRIGIQQMEFHKYNPGPNNILFNHKLYNPIEHFEKSPTRQNKQSQNKHPKKPDEGVGKLPFKNVQSVSELLCFNTNMNVYHKYHGADPLQANYHTTMMMMAMEGTSNKSDNKNHDFASANNLYIDPAPPSLSKDSIYDMYWGNSASQEQNIKAFAPTRRELPMFEFPSNLGLPNIVDTAQWDLSLDNMPSIAPSSLPSLDLGNSNSTSMNSSTLPSSMDPTISSTPSVPSTANVPPPPVTTGVVPPPPVTMGNVPPPPIVSPGVSMGNVPPPVASGVPQIPSIPSVVTPNAEGTGEEAEDNEGGGDRNDLLASIRNFSKNKLKQANKIREKESSKEVTAPQKTSGDMMTDLFRKIGLRRNAIEGSKDDKKPKKKKKEKKVEEPIPIPTPSSTPTNISTGHDSSAVTELPKMPPPPKRPQSDDDSDGSDVDSW